MSDREIPCEEVIAQLFAYLDGDLEHAHSIDIDRHLERCRDCYTRAEFERRLREKVRDASNAAAPERLHRRIKGILDRF